MASGSKKVIIAALIGNSLIAAAKYIGAAVSGSSAMLTEGIHSTVDTCNQLLLLLGAKRAKKPADERHPFGHGKEIYFWGFLVALLIFALGAGISIYEGIHSLMDPQPIESFTTNYIVLGLAFVFESVAWYVALKEFRKTKGRRSYVQAVKESKDPQGFVILFEDSAAMIGLLFALVGNLLVQFTGDLFYDGIASILIGLVLAVTALWLAIETKGLLIGETADKEIVDRIREMADTNPQIDEVFEILTLHMGPDYILVNINVHFRTDLSADQLVDSIAALTQDITDEFARVKRVFIEAEEMKRQK